MKLTMPIFYKNNQNDFQMPAGFPKYNIFDANRMEVILRFKIFEGSINYDTLVNMYPEANNENFFMGMVAIFFFVITLVGIIKIKKSRIKSATLENDPQGAPYPI